MNRVGPTFEKAAEPTVSQPLSFPLQACRRWTRLGERKNAAGLGRPAGIVFSSLVRVPRGLFREICSHMSSNRGELPGRRRLCLSRFGGIPVRDFEKKKKR